MLHRNSIEGLDIHSLSLVFNFIFSLTLLPLPLSTTSHIQRRALCSRAAAEKTAAKAEADAVKVRAETKIAELTTELMQKAEAKAEAEAVDGAAAASGVGVGKPSLTANIESVDEAQAAPEAVTAAAHAAAATTTTEDAGTSAAAAAAAAAFAAEEAPEIYEAPKGNHSTTFASLVGSSHSTDSRSAVGVNVFLPTKEQRWKPLTTYPHSPGTIDHTDIKRYLTPVKDWGQPGDDDTIEAALKGLDAATTPLVVTFANKVG